MKKISLILLLSAGLLSCKKEVAQPLSTAEFTFNGNADKPPFLVGMDIPITNNSTNAVSYLWDLGYGKTSTDKEPIFDSDKAGTFTVSLTAANADGKLTTSKQQVQVLQMASSTITLQRLSLDEINMDKADIWLEIMEINPNNAQIQPDGSYLGRLIFKSPILKNLTNNSKEISIPVAEPIEFNWGTAWSKKGLCYVYSLFTYKNNEKTLIFNTRSSGGSTSYRGDMKIRSFEIVASMLTSSVRIQGYFRP